MEELIEKLKTDTSAALAKLTACRKDPLKLKMLKNEYQEIDRTLRDSQVGQIQKDKYVGKGEKRRKVVGVRIPVPFQNKIATTATAFEVGEPLTLKVKETNDLSAEIELLWKNNRIDSHLIKMIHQKKSELQSALLFYIKDITKNSFNKPRGKATKKEIKVKFLENDKGIMSPYFDAHGDMKAFTWEYTMKESIDKEIKYAWVYDEKYVHECKEIDGKMTYQESKMHGFEKIPIVYTSQEHPEWHNVQSMIDRLEVSLSKLGAANDYTAHPILMLFGEIGSNMDKDEDGKVLRFNIVQDDTTGKTNPSGKAEYLTRESQAETVKLELEQLEKYIYSLTSTPDISFNNIKGLGTISGIAIKLMFLDAIIKAKLNEGDNRTMVERIINIFIAGTVNTTATSLRSQAENTFIDVQFNSILPDDLKDTVEVLARAVESKIMSVKTAIEILDLADTDEELTQLKEDLKNKLNEPVTQ